MKLIIKICICFNILSCFAFGQSKIAQLNQLMKTYHNYNLFDGAVLVAENGKAIYKGAFGNVYLALNQKEAAILQYKKTLQITPGMEEAKSRLRDLGIKQYP